MKHRYASWNSLVLALAIATNAQGQIAGITPDLTVVVPANGGWVTTGVTLGAGDVVVVVAKGAILHQGDGIWSDPDGIGMCQDDMPCSWCAMGSLIGRIGGGEPFRIGSHRAFRADVEGPFDLCVNDSYLGDNDGSFAAMVYHLPEVLSAVPRAGEPDPGIDILAHPNPTTGGATIQYSLPQRASVEVAVYDIAGRLVRTLFVGASDAGPNSIAWDGRMASGGQAPSGTYFVSVRCGNRSQQERIMIVH